jgi:acyl-CoA dehydrogenase
VVVPGTALRVIDRAIQAHGAAGVSDDFPLASAWAHTRTIRFADGPDEVHRDAIAKLEIRKYQ